MKPWNKEISRQECATRVPHLLSKSTVNGTFTPRVHNHVERTRLQSTKLISSITLDSYFIKETPGLSFLATLKLGRPRV